LFERNIFHRIGSSDGGENNLMLFLTLEVTGPEFMPVADGSSVGFPTHQIRQRKMEDHQFERKFSGLIKGLIKSRS
jgi:hypothetical protein